MPERVSRIAEILDMKKADDIVVLDVRDLTIISDYFVVASAMNVNHAKMLADEVLGRMGEGGLLPLRTEGMGEGRWIVMDYGDVLVHIFHKTERNFYQLERLWEADNNFVNYSEEREAEQEERRREENSVTA